MTYDTSKDTITVNDITYDVEREQDRGGSGEETLTIRDYDVETDEFVNPFPGLEATLGYMDDGYGMSPRDWSNVGTMSVVYHGYDLGDENIQEIDFKVECNFCDGTGEREEKQSANTTELFPCEMCHGNGEFQINPVDYFKQKRGARVVLPLSVYEHSGITMFVGHNDYTFDPGGWDTSYVGFIFDTPEGIKECYGDKQPTDEEIEQNLRSEVKVYASYLEGDITWYSVIDEETDFSDGCGGYVGDHEECERECFAALEQAVIKRLAENKERAYWLQRGVETV